MHLFRAQRFLNLSKTPSQKIREISRTILPQKYNTSRLHENFESYKNNFRSPLINRPENSFRGSFNFLSTRYLDIFGPGTRYVGKCQFFSLLAIFPKQIFHKKISPLAIRGEQQSTTLNKKEELKNRKQNVCFLYEHTELSIFHNSRNLA